MVPSESVKDFLPEKVRKCDKTKFDLYVLNPKVESTICFLNFNFQRWNWFDYFCAHFVNVDKGQTIWDGCDIYDLILYMEKVKSSNRTDRIFDNFQLR